MVRQLLRMGANVEARQKAGATALLVAALSGHAAVVRALLEVSDHEALQARDNDGDTPLHVAAGQGHTEVVRALAAAKAALEARTETGLTPLFLAASKGHAASVQVAQPVRAQ